MGIYVPLMSYHNFEEGDTKLWDCSGGTQLEP